MNADVERSKQNVAAYTGLDISFLKDMPLNVWSYQIDPAKWQAVADMMHEQRRAAEAAQGRRIYLRHRQAVCEEIVIYACASSAIRASGAARMRSL